MKRPKPNIPQISADEIVESKATPCENQALAFRNWHYVEVRGGLSKAKMNQWLCIDTGAHISCVNREWLHKNLPDCKIRIMEDGVGIRGIKGIDRRKEFADFDIY